jgi:hypothetical protein
MAKHKRTFTCTAATPYSREAVQPLLDSLPPGVKCDLTIYHDAWAQNPDRGPGMVKCGNCGAESYDGRRARQRKPPRPKLRLVK